MNGALRDGPAGMTAALEVAEALPGPADIILHHYAGSPFSEKVRLVLGMKGLAWHSVDVPVIMPKPDVVALTGGYRRTPFMQIVADVYCDSALMCRVIDRIAPEPSLYPAATGGLADIVAQWADSMLFWTAVPYTMQPAAAPYLFPSGDADALKAFRDDRAQMTGGMRRLPLADAAVVVARYAGWLERQLEDGRPWLLGAVPCIADFAVVHSIWFMHRAPPVAALLDPYPRLAAWYERMRGFGHGRSSALSSAAALQVASRGTPSTDVSVQAGQGLDAGIEVSVTPVDYALDPVAGTLVGLDADEIVLARRDPRAGFVHVHFPCIGFQVKPATPASH